MPQPTKRKAAHKKVNRNEQGKLTKEVEIPWVINTEVNTSEEQSEMGNTLSEYNWENYEVSDWGKVVLIWKDKIHGK